MFKKVISCFLLAASIFITSSCWHSPKAPSATQKNKIIVVSDLHLGIDDNISEMVSNRALFVNFMKQIAQDGNVRELVIDGDFLDDWYLPLDYPAYTNTDAFYEKVIQNNQVVMDELNNLIKSGVKVVYIPGNHDMLIKSGILGKAMPGIVEIYDADGLGLYITGDRDEIAIEHCHRYDVFSAPDAVSNAELAGTNNTILPPGYFYARTAASWVLQGRPNDGRTYPTIDTADVKKNTDQYNAYVYYKVFNAILQQTGTPNETFEQKVVDVKIAGLNGIYSIQDFYPVMQSDGDISAPTLFKNFQRSWDERQTINKVRVHKDFATAVAGAAKYEYFADQAKEQLFDDPDKNIEIAVFGHTHRPHVKEYSGKKYLNSGTWIDHNSNSSHARTYVVITTGASSTAELYKYNENSTSENISDLVRD